MLLIFVRRKKKVLLSTGENYKRKFKTLVYLEESILTHRSLNVFWRRLFFPFRFLDRSFLSLSLLDRKPGRARAISIHLTPNSKATRASKVDMNVEGFFFARAIAQRQERASVSAKKRKTKQETSSLSQNYLAAQYTCKNQNPSLEEERRKKRKKENAKYMTFDQIMITKITGT